MSFYSDLATEVLALLTEFGTDGTLVKRVAGEYNPNTAEVEMTETQYAVKVALFEIKEKQRSEGQEVAAGNTATIARMRRALISASGLAVVIDSEDTLIVSGLKYKIVDPGPVLPATTVVVYDAKVSA